MNTETQEPTTETTEATIKLPNPPFITSLKSGSHAVTITKAAIVANHNGKANLHLEGDNGTRILQYNMYLTSPAAKANTAKQIKRAFDIDLQAEQKAGNLTAAVKSIVGRKASFRVELEEYNGRISPKVKFVNPEGSTELSDEALAGLTFDDAGPQEVNVQF